MVSIVTKRIKAKEYLYLVVSERVGDRVIQKTVAYIGKKRPILKEEFASMKFSYQRDDWILNQCEDTLSYQDHTLMKNCSTAYKAHFARLDRISQKKEKEKFLSIFISNSNAIEGSTMTVKDTYNFLFKDISPAGHTKKELFMATNLLAAWYYMEKNCKRFPKHTDLWVLHSLVNRGIEGDMTLGRYKPVQNYIGDVYTTSYLFTKQRMDDLFLWIKKAYKTVDDFEVAFQSHAQFEIIHPFVDGNGRVGRLLLNWLLLRCGLMPLAISSQQRAQYIGALDAARKGKIEAIAQFCFKEYVEQYKFH